MHGANADSPWSLENVYSIGQGEALTGVAALGVLAYLWLVANGQA